MRFVPLAAVLAGLALSFAGASAARADEAAPTLPVPPVAAPVRELKPVGDVESEIRDAAHLYNLDPALVRAVAQQESGLRNEARSHRGALGVMQLMPKTAADLGYDAADLRGNVRAGAAYLSMMMEAFGGDVKRALAAYNAGPGAVKKYGGVPPFSETRNYVTSIMSKMAVNAATAVSQPLTTTVAQIGATIGGRAVQGVAQVAAQAAAPAAGVLGGLAIGAAHGGLSASAQP